MKKYLIYALIIILFCVIGLLLFMPKDERKDTTIKVGAAIALTGFGSDFGQSERNAIELLKEKYSDYELNFFVEDSKSEVRDGINATKKLLDVNKVDIIYCDLSTIVNATNDMIKNAGKVLIAPVYLDDLTQKNSYAIRNLPSAKQEIDTLLSYLNNNNIKSDTYALLYSNDIFGETTKTIFEKTVGSDAIVFSSAIIDDNIKSIALKLMQSKMDVIYIGSMSSHVGLMIKELRILGYNREIITTDAFSYDYIYGAAGDYAKGVIYIDYPTDKESYIKFTSDYKNRFKSECPSTAILCYDGLSLLIEQLIKDPQKEFLDSIVKFDGIYGELQLINREIIYPIKAVRW